MRALNRIFTKFLICMASVTAMIAGAGAMTSCMQCNGYIGIWFGSWVVEEITVDGEPDPAYPPEARRIFINFQGKVFGLAPMDMEYVMGSWEESGDNLVLHAAFNAIADAWPPALGFGDSPDLTFRILKKDKKDLQLQLACPDGKVRIYHLRHIL